MYVRFKVVLLAKERLNHKAHEIGKGIEYGGAYKIGTWKMQFLYLVMAIKSIYSVL